MAKKRTEEQWQHLLYEIYHFLAWWEDPDNLPSLREISRKFNVPFSTLIHRLKLLGIDTRKPRFVLRGIEQSLKLEQIEKAREAALVFLDRKEGETPDWREFVELAEANQEMQKRIDPSQRIATVQIKTDHPIAIMFTSDWHLGDGRTDHKTWQEDIEFVLDNPDLFMIDLGDDRQNARRFRVVSNILNQVISPKQQAMMLRGIVDELTREDKLIAKIGGNHDEEWDEKIFGEAIQHYLLEKMKAPRFRNKGLIKLTVGEQLYTLLVFHKTRFRSFLRQSHGAMREHQLAYPADIVAGGHDHEPGMEHHHHYRLAAEADMGFGGETFLIKTGTYQDSDYGWRYFHNGGFPTNYTVVLWPDEKKMLCFPDPRDAMVYIDGIKSKVRG